MQPNMDGYRWSIIIYFWFGIYLERPKSLSGLVVHRQSMELLSSLPVRLDEILEFTKLQY